MAQTINELLDQIIARYQPGAGFEKAAEDVLARRKTDVLAKERQGLVSAGLGGTTIGAGLETKFEERVATPYRLGIEETRVGALTQAMQAKAGFLERAEARETETALRLWEGRTPTMASRGLSATGTPLRGGIADIQQSTAPADATATATGGVLSQYGQNYYGGDGMTPMAAGDGAGGRLYSEQMGAGGGDIMAAAASRYREDVAKEHPGTNLSFITTEYYKRILSETPRNPSRGVWKAYMEAGGK